jgi:two-component system chemotaxis sensor kinase CheA
MKRILNSILLPKQISDFERRYLQRMNRLGLVFFALHVPVFIAIALFNDTGPVLAAVLGLAALAGPMLAYFSFSNPRSISLTYGFTAMLMGGILVHVGQGPVQIEMHFYFFALLAMLALYGNPAVIIVAAVTVSVHHLLLWMVLPTSVFNYAAPIWVVLVHAAFVVLESIATCYIARSFFDNVIGLEKIVQIRTAELDARTKDMRLVLDNVDQGFLTIDRAGVLSREHSAIVTKWLGEPQPGSTFAAYLGAQASTEGELFELGFEQVIEGFLPLDEAVAQLPKQFSARGKAFDIHYTPIVRSGELEKLLIIISDVTSARERARLESEQRDMVRAFERLMHDRSGFVEFFEEARDLVRAIVNDEIKDPAALNRVIHTLKGNASIFGINAVADYCHELETQIQEDQEPPTVQQRNELAERFDRLRTKVDVLLGDQTRKNIEVESSEYEATLQAIAGDESRTRILRRVADWKLEPTSVRLERIADRARRIADRLNKGPLDVVVRDNGLRLEAPLWAAFWSSFIHVVRNAVDHGIESKPERLMANKNPRGAIELVTRLERGTFIVEIKDDGRGIDWNAVAERASAAAVPCDSPEDLMQAIFTDGISTAPSVTEVSGRGIGMGAMRAVCEARGGTMEVSSVTGAGTSVVFRFPESAMVSAGRENSHAKDLVPPPNNSSSRAVA